MHLSYLVYGTFSVFILNKRRMNTKSITVFVMQTCRTTRKIFSSSIRKLCKTQVKFQIQRNIQAKLLRSLATFGSANTYWKCSITNLNDEHRCVKSTFCFVGLKQHQRSAMVRWFLKGGEQQQSFLVEREKQRTLCTKHSSCSTLVYDSIMVYRCILYMLFIAHTHTWLGILPRLHDNDNSNWNHDDEKMCWKTKWHQRFWP